MNGRVLKEIKKAQESKLFTFFFDETGKYGEKNIAYAATTFSNGPYAGQRHVFSFKFVYGHAPHQYTYPKNAPNVICQTPIFHPNIATSGSICLDVIKDDAWSPLYGIETIFNSIVGLMDDPNTSSPFNCDASTAYKKYKSNEAEYRRICFDYYEKNKSKAKELLAAPELRGNLIADATSNTNVAPTPIPVPSVSNNYSALPNGGSVAKK